MHKICPVRNAEKTGANERHYGPRPSCNQTPTEMYVWPLEPKYPHCWRPCALQSHHQNRTQMLTVPLRILTTPSFPFVLSCTGLGPLPSGLLRGTREGRRRPRMPHGLPRAFAVCTRNQTSGVRATQISPSRPGHTPSQMRVKLLNATSGFMPIHQHCMVCPFTPYSIDPHDFLICAALFVVISHPFPMQRDD